MNYPYKLIKEQITPYERLLITLFLQVALSAFKDILFSLHDYLVEWH